MTRKRPIAPGELWLGRDYQSQEGLGVPALQALLLAALDQPLQGVLAHRFQHAHAR